MRKAKHGKTVAYSTRHMEVVLLDRLRKLAKDRGISMEAALNMVIAVGLGIVEEA